MNLLNVNMTREMRCVMCITCLYLYVTLGEWFIHKHVMHNEEFDPGHIRHHKSVNIDMTLDDDEFIEDDIQMGSQHTVMITMGTACISNVIINKIFEMDISKYNIIMGSILLALFYKVMWNKYHRKMHFESEFFEKTANPYLKWIYFNHSIHHLQKGVLKGNYNILFPGGDHIMGDYRTIVDNTTYCYEDKLNNICKHSKVFDKIPKKINIIEKEQ